MPLLKSLLHVLRDQGKKNLGRRKSLDASVYITPGLQFCIFVDFYSNLMILTWPNGVEFDLYQHFKKELRKAEEFGISSFENGESTTSLDNLS